MKKLFITAAVLPLLAAGLTGCSASGITKAAQMVDQARKVQKTAKTVENVTGQDMGLIADPLNMEGRAEAKYAEEQAESAALLAEAEPIETAPMAVAMRKTSGKTSVLSLKPKLAIVGYNVAAFTEGKVQGTARGGLFGNSQGASSTLELVSTGIDAGLVQRVADAASEDLVAQLTLAGFDVVDPYGVSQAESNVVMKAGGAPEERKLTTYKGEKMNAIIAGPTTYGFRLVNSGVAKGGFGALSENAGNKPAKLTEELGAVLIQPTIVLDFANMKANRTIGRKATSNAELSFSLDPMSTVQVHSSKGRGLNWLTYGTKKGASSDAPFAMLGEKDTSTNALEQGLGAALGMATRAKKKTTQAVIIDPVRYEALALSAAKGWNAAFVEQVVAARSKES